MEPVTIFLDEQDDKRANRFCRIWTAISLFWIAQGTLGIFAPPPRFPFLPWVNLLSGTVLLCFILVSLLSRRKYGRVRLVLTETGLEVKTREFGRAEEVRWENVAGVHFRLNRVDILRKTHAGEPITVKNLSYVLNQQVRDALEKFATARNLEISREA